MAVFALGIKHTDECYPILVSLLETDPDYGIRADAAGALGYLGDPRAFEPLVRAFTKTLNGSCALVRQCHWAILKTPCS
jgi:HEAT repeat protein